MTTRPRGGGDSLRCSCFPRWRDLGLSLWIGVEEKPRRGVRPSGRTGRVLEVDRCAGFRKKAHGKTASIPERRVQAPGRRGVRRWRDPAWSGKAARPLQQSDPRLGSRSTRPGAFDEDASAADLIQAYEARIAELERLVGKQSLELEFLRGASVSAARGETRLHPSSAVTWPLRGSRMPADGPAAFHFLRGAGSAGRRSRDRRLHARDLPICDEFEAYGFRRVGAALRHQGVVDRRQRQEDPPADARARPAAETSRRFVATTDSDHDRPIFPNRATLIRGQLSAPVTGWGSRLCSAR
jgi:hypothetical protein